jgi:hypothetical protein
MSRYKQSPQSIYAGVGIGRQTAVILPVFHGLKRQTTKGNCTMKNPIGSNPVLHTKTLIDTGSRRNKISLMHKKA